MQYTIAFLEGMITFISPCLLPMLPIYLSYFAGGGERTTGKTITGALGFVTGFTVVFVTLGGLAGTYHRKFFETVSDSGSDCFRSCGNCFRIEFSWSIPVESVSWKPSFC